MLTRFIKCRFASKIDAHMVKEKDAKRDMILKDSKAVFSKDRKSKKFTLIDIKIPDLNKQKSEYFIFDKNTVPVPRDVYVPPLTKSMKTKIQQKEYMQFREQLNQVQEVEEQQDELWEGEVPIKYYEKARGKDLFFNFRSPKFQEYIARKIDFLPKPDVKNGDIKQTIENIKQQSKKQLQQLYLPNFFIEDYYKKQEGLFQQLKSQIQEASYKELPQIALSLQFDILYKQDIYKIWHHIQEVVNKHIHHYTAQELILLKMGFASTFPKAGDHNLHSIIKQLVEEDFDKLSVDDLINASYAFRHLQPQKFALKISEALIKKLPEYQQNSTKLANVFYSVANNYTPKNKRLKQKDLLADDKERVQIMQGFAEALKNGKYTNDEAIKVILGVLVLKVPNFEDVVYAAESQLKPDFDEYQTAHILYGLSKANNGQTTGEEATYEKLVPYVWKYWDKFEDLEKSRIFYAYACRNSKVAEDPRFLAWIRKGILNFQYSELQNIVYGLMFQGNKDKDIWMGFARNIGYSDEWIPLSNYYAFKQAKFWIQHHFPLWNLSPIEQASQQAEYMFMATRLNRYYFNEEQVDFQTELSTLVDYNWKPFFSWENLYYLQIIIEEYRLAIAYSTLEVNGKPKAQLLLQQKILSFKDWKLIIFSQSYLATLTVKQKQEYMKKIIDEAMDEQKKKMKGWDDARRQELFWQLEQQTERTLTPGKRITMPEDLKGLSRTPFSK